MEGLSPMKGAVAAFAVAGVAILWASTTDAQELAWRVYSDAEHGCELDYPGAIFTADAMRADEPRRFSSSNEDIYFRVLGTENTAGWTPAEIKRKYLGSSMPGKVVYERTKNTFLVLSGYRDGNIFYTKVVVSDDRQVACILDMTYPRAMKDRFDGIVTRMSRSFSVAD
ncbi:MAG: hypothetical protein ACREDW_08195 [Aestuariivirgaceae bacterium]